MAKKIKAYVDTSALISFLDASDSYHGIFSRLFAEPPGLVSTPLVLAEGHAWFLRRYDSGRAIQFLNFIEELEPLRLVAADKTLYVQGAALIKKFRDQPLTLTDAVGLALMREMGLRSCWSTDRHLGLTGVPLIIHQQGL